MLIVVSSLPATAAEEKSSKPFPTVGVIRIDYGADGSIEEELIIELEDQKVPATEALVALRLASTGTVSLN